MGATIGCKDEIAAFLRGDESTLYEDASGAGMLGPRIRNTAETHQYPGLESTQSAFLHEAHGQPSKMKSLLVGVKSRPKEHGEGHIPVARGITVPVNQAEIHHAADDEAIEIGHRRTALPTAPS